MILITSFGSSITFPSSKGFLPNAMVWHPAVVQWSLILIITTCSPPSNMYGFCLLFRSKVVPTPLLGAAPYSFQESVFRGLSYFVLNIWGALKSMKWCRTSLPVFLVNGRFWWKNPLPDRPQLRQLPWTLQNITDIKVSQGKHQNGWGLAIIYIYKFIHRL